MGREDRVEPEKIHILNKAFRHFVFLMYSSTNIPIIEELLYNENQYYATILVTLPILLEGGGTNPTSG